MCWCQFSLGEHQVRLTHTHTHTLAVEKLHMITGVHLQTDRCVGCHGYCVFLIMPPEDTAFPVSVKMKNSYVGCVRSLSINQHTVNFKHTLINGVVSVDSCPVA